MAEYKSFHYLMHNVPEAVKPVYVTGPSSLSFAELYTPRDADESGKPAAPVLIHKSEKSFWRTRDRVEVAMYEDRSVALMIVTCRNVEQNQCYRTLFVDLETLYFEVEAKAQGHREKLVRKKERKLLGDALNKAAADYILARLNIIADPIPWPILFSVEEHREKVGTASAAPAAADVAPTAETVATEEVDIHKERMCTINKLASDAYDFLEIAPPPNFQPGIIEHTKLQPTIESQAISTEMTLPDSTPDANDSAEQVPTVAEAPTPLSADIDAQVSSPVKVKPAAVNKSTTPSTTTTPAAKGKAAVTPAATTKSKTGKGALAASPTKKTTIVKNNKVAPTP